jgi:hypothetical protein
MTKTGPNDAFSVVWALGKPYFISYFSVFLNTVFSVIGVNLLSKGATHLVQKIAPTGEQLRNVDRSASDDEFFTAGGRPAGPKETPVLELSVPGTNKNVQ